MEASLGQVMGFIKNDRANNFGMHVNDTGIKGDFDPDDPTSGTDAAPAFNYAINKLYAAGGGTLYFKGKYKLLSAIHHKAGVSLVGMGPRYSVLYPVGINYSAIEGLGGSMITAYKDFMFEDFEIDAINLGDSSLPYTWAEKCIYIQYIQRATFRNLYLHDAPASTLGIDFLDDTLIDNVINVRAGRLFGIHGGLAVGGSGLGIGTGAWDYENLKIVNCESHDCGNFGLFFEKQAQIKTTPTTIRADGVYSKGMRVDNCNFTGNTNAGVSDAGVENLIMSNCNMYDNAGHGFKVYAGGKNGKVSNCRIYGNGDSGVYVDNSQTGNGNDYKVNDCDIYSNAKHGMYLYKDISPFKNFNAIDNRIYSNGANGIKLYSSVDMEDLVIENNEIYGNGTAAIANNTYGILIDANLKNQKIKNNRCYDRQGTKTQSVGVKLTAGKTITGGTISDNDLKDNTTPMLLEGTISNTTIILRNKGYNDDDSVANANPGASPWTRTAGSRPEVLYLIGTGITVTINGSNVLVGATNATVPLDSFKSCTVTYTTLTSAKVAYK